MIRKLIFSLCLLIGGSLLAQPPSKFKNDIHLTFLGPGGYGSIGYNRTIPALGTRLFRSEVGASVGLFSVGYEEKYWSQYRLLLEFNTVWFEGLNHLEVGVLLPGGVETKYSGTKISSMPLIPNYRIGWRIEGPMARTYIRVGFSSITYIGAEPEYWPLLPYVGTGLKF